VGLGEIAFDDIPGLIEIEATFEPDARNRSTYDGLHREFLAIYKATRAICDRLNRKGVSS
jgi:xylulokinase